MKLTETQKGWLVVLGIVGVFALAVWAAGAWLDSFYESLR